MLVALQKRAVVADESHIIKNGKALRTCAAIEIARSVPDDGVILAMSGSAVLNRRKEVASQIDFIGRLNEFGGADAIGNMTDLAKIGCERGAWSVERRSMSCRNSRPACSGGAGAR